MIRSRSVDSMIAEIKDVKRNANAAHKHIDKHEVDFHGDPLAKFKK